jgi:hypothetical protein
MATFFANSTMTSAPSLNTTDNTSLCNVLDACLVNGFGSYTSPAWSTLYTSTGIRVYQAPKGNRFPLYINENAFASQTTAMAQGMQSFTSIDPLSVTPNGYNLFPQVRSRGIYMPKYGSASTTSIPWWFFGNQKCFWFFTAVSVQSGTYGTAGATYKTVPFFYGDYSSFIDGNPYNSIIIGSNTLATTTAQYNGFTLNKSSSGMSTATSTTTTYGMYVANSFNGENPAATASLTQIFNSNVGTTSGTVPSSIYDPVTGRGVMQQAMVSVAGNASILGKFPGLWIPQNNSTFTTGANSGDTATDSIYNTNTTFYYFTDYNYFSCFIEYNPSTTWS